MNTNTYTFELTAEGYVILNNGALFFDQRTVPGEPGYIPLAGYSDAAKAAYAQAEIDGLVAVTGGAA